MRQPRLLIPIAWLFGCSTVASSPNYDDEVGGEYDSPVHGQEAPQTQPNGVTFSALEFAQPYSRLAVGNVARGVEEPGCCLDYALAGPTADDVRVVFGGGSNDGLTFLDDRPDEVLPLGPLDDVLLVDLDENGRNDLVGLRTENGREVVVRLGVPMPPTDGPFLMQEGVGTSTVTLYEGEEKVGHRDFVQGDLDCDGHLDLAIASPTANAVIVLRGRGDGSFETADSFPIGADPDRGSVRVLVAQLDGDGGEDIATANNDGSISVLLANDCSGEFPHLQRIALKSLSEPPCDKTTTNCWLDTETAVIAAGDFCPSAGLDLAYAFEEQVWIVCGDAGDFDGVGEQPHQGSVEGAPAADYFFDLDGESHASPNGRIDDALVWQDQLYVLRLPPVSQAIETQGKVVLDSHRLVRLVVDDDQVLQDLGEPVLTLYTQTSRIILHPAASDDPTLRLVWPALGLARWEQP